MSSKKNFLIVISSPSGGGKSTLVAALIQHVPGVRLSVSHTTRAPRPNEINGKDYWFVHYSDFLGMRNRGEFFESAEVFGNHYGTSKRAVEEILAAGFDVALDIDVQGAAQIRNAFPDAVTIFILPPSFSVLKQRLVSRRTESLTMIHQRMEAARKEVTRYTEFHYVVVNDDLEQATKALEGIVRAERQRRFRQDEKARTILQSFQVG